MLSVLINVKNTPHYLINFSRVFSTPVLIECSGHNNARAHSKLAFVHFRRSSARVTTLGGRPRLHQAWLHHFFPNENNKKRELGVNSDSAYTLLRCSFVAEGRGIGSVLFHKELRFLL